MKAIRKGAKQTIKNMTERLHVGDHAIIMTLRTNCYGNLSQLNGPTFQKLIEVERIEKFRKGFNFYHSYELITGNCWPLDCLHKARVYTSKIIVESEFSVDETLDLDDFDDRCLNQLQDTIYDHELILLHNSRIF